MVMTGKQLSHIIRLYQFILNLTSGLSFKNSLTYFENEIKIMIITAKLNEYSLDKARQLAQEYANKIHNIKEAEILARGVIVKDEVVNFLLDLKLKILKNYFTEQLKPDIKEEIKVFPDNYSKVWITSDNHFGHENILKYEDRKSKLNIENIQEHDQILINNWNSVVGKNDLIYIVGDFSFKKAKDTENLLRQLNGDKVLIKGNHDIFLDDKTFDKSLFKAIYDYKEVKYKGQEIVLMHYPIQEFKHMNRETKPTVLLFGHIHSFKLQIPKYSYNVGVDVNGYFPISLMYAIERALENQGGRINNV